MVHFEIFVVLTAGASRNLQDEPCRSVTAQVARRRMRRQGALCGVSHEC
jgi:hypothetical protein